MSDAPSLDDPVTVSADAVTVDKSFVGDEFPVPAVKFDLTSTADEPVRIKLIDRIPEAFPMEGVGFHPEFESGNWTAYKDHRVEFVRTLAPGEELTTVYGVRLGADDDSIDFLTEPSVELVPFDDVEEGPTDVAEIVGDDDTRIVREVLSGERDVLPGLEPREDAISEADLAAAVTDADSVEGDDSVDGVGSIDGVDSIERADPADEGVDDETADDGVVDVADDELGSGDGDKADAGDEVVGDEADAGDEVVGDEVVGDEVVGDEVVGDDVVGTVGSGDVAAVDGVETEVQDDVDRDGAEPSEAAAPSSGGRVADDAEVAALDDSVAHDGPTAEDDEITGYVDVDDAVDGSEGETPSFDTSDLAAALAAELRDGNVAEDDLAVLRDALGPGVPRSVDVRIRRLQSRTDDLLAYRDALAAFIDEHGTGAELIVYLEDAMDDVRTELEGLDATLSEADHERAELRSDLRAVRNDLRELDGVREAVDDVRSGVDEAGERLTGVEAELGDVGDRLHDTAGSVEQTAERVDDLRSDLGSLDADVGSLDARVGSLDEEVGDVREDVAGIDGAVHDVRDDLEGEVADLRAELDDLRTTVSDLETLSNLDGDVSDLQEAVVELEEFRDRLRSTFGTPGEE